jgi:hypothetical protein
MSKILVLGGGIVGLSTAGFYKRRCQEKTLLPIRWERVALDIAFYRTRLCSTSKTSEEEELPYSVQWEQHTPSVAAVWLIALQRQIA